MAAPATLPANFTGWDKPSTTPKAPDTLPANFSGWDAPPPPSDGRVAPVKLPPELAGPGMPAVPLPQGLQPEVTPRRTNDAMETGLPLGAPKPLTLDSQMLAQPSRQQLQSAAGPAGEYRQSAPNLATGLTHPEKQTLGEQFPEASDAGLAAEVVKKVFNTDIGTLVPRASEDSPEYEKIQQGAYRFLGSMISPKQVAIGVGTAGAAEAIPAIANLPIVAERLKDMPQVLKALDLLSRTVVPAAIGVAGAKGMVESGLPTNLEDATTFALNALMAGAGVAGAVSAGHDALITGKTIAPPEAPTGRRAAGRPSAEELGGIETPSLAPGEAKAKAEALSSVGRNLTAQLWKNLDHTQPTEINTTAGKLYLQPSKKVGGRSYEEVLDANGKQVVAGTPEIVRAKLNQMGAEIPQSIVPKSYTDVSAPVLVDEKLTTQGGGLTKGVDVVGSAKHVFGEAPETLPADFQGFDEAPPVASSKEVVQKSSEAKPEATGEPKMDAAAKALVSKLQDAKTTVLPIAQAIAKLDGREDVKGKDVAEAAAIHAGGGLEELAKNGDDQELKDRAAEIIAAQSKSEVAPLSTEESTKVDNEEPKTAVKVDKEEPKQYDFHSTQVNLPKDYANKVREFGAKIPDAALAEDGREETPHVTVRYGLKDPADADAVRELLADEGPIKAKVGKVSIFPASKDSDYDVVKFDVQSEDLNRLNKKIANALPHEDTHPGYSPHVTVAYLKKGEGKKYAGRAVPGITGKEITFNSLTFSGKDGEKVDIPLGQSKSAVEPKVNAPVVAAKAPVGEQPGNTTPQQAFKMKGPELKDLASKGDTGAQAEIDRRSGKKAPPAEKGVTPDRRRIIHRGAHEPVTVEFGDAKDTEVFDAVAKSSLSRASGKNPRGMDFEPLIRQRDAWAQRLNLTPQATSNLLRDYHAYVKDLAKAQPKDDGGTIKPDSLREFERGRVTAQNEAAEKQAARSEEEKQHEALVKFVQTEQAKAKAKPVKSSDKSVKTLPVTVEVKNGTVTATTKADRKPFASVSFPVSEWPSLGKPGVSANPAYDQSQFLRKKLQDAGISFDENIEVPGQEQAVNPDRLVDSHRHAIADAVLKHEAETNRAEPETKAPGPETKQATTETTPPVTETPERPKLTVAQRMAARAKKEADEAEKELRAMGFYDTINTGLPPAAILPLVKIGVNIMAQGIVSAERWKGAMIAKIGAKITPFLDMLYTQAMDRFERMMAEAHAEANGPTAGMAEQPQTEQAAPAEQKADNVEEQPDVTEPESGQDVQPPSPAERAREEDQSALGGVSPEDVQEPGGGSPTEQVGDVGSTGDGADYVGPEAAGPELRQGKRDRQRRVLPSAERAGSANAELRSGDSPGTGLGADYRLSPEEAAAVNAGGSRAKSRNNLEAIRAIKTIQAEGNRPATPEEQKAISRYVGWGDSELANGVFGGKPEWAGVREDLKSLLSDEEYKAAERSTINAHYTRMDLANAMWDAAVRLGFRAGGSVAELGMGIGNFFITMPEELNQGTSRTGVEMDVLTGSMAKALYPGSNVIVKPLQEANLPDGYFDLIIGNFPFGKVALYDPEFKRTPFLTQAIHNYFFAKAMNKLRPGGVIVSLTSRGTLDSPSAEPFRKWMNKEAELLGAIRLPRDTFKVNAGTAVTTDIVILRKRIPGGLPAGSDPAWVSSPAFTMNDGGVLNLNEYFQAHPEMMLGEMQGGSMYRRGYPELFGEYSTPAVAKAFESLPSDVIPSWENQGRSVDIMAEAYPDSAQVKNGGYALQNGAIVQREGAYMRPVPLSGKKLDRMKGLLEIRGAARDAIRTQAMDLSEGEILAASAALNKAYDKFVAKNGPINSLGNTMVFADDPDWPLLSSLEDIEKVKVPDASAKSGFRTDLKATKRDIFSKRTIERPKPVEHVDTGSEALSVALNEVGRIDWDKMQQLSGRTPDELKKELRGKIFQDPVSRVWETADEYLSGNVRKKLREAEFAATSNPDYEANVESLKLVQPEDKTPGRIGVNLGANWIPNEVYDAFMEHQFKAERQPDDPGFVTYVPQTGGYGIREPKHLADGGVASKSTFGTPYFTGLALFEMAMNGQSPIAKDTIYVGDGKYKDIKNPRATIEANNKQAAIQDGFTSWIWQDPARTDMLVKRFNEERNNIRLREFDGSHLTLPGLNRSWLRGGDLDSHQKNAVWRIIQNGNTLLAHAVGAGKTLEIVVAVMELKRLGLARKPMIPVPNHLVAQWKDSFLLAYPSAQILVPTKKDFQGLNRKKLMTRIATGNYDAVIVGHNGFKLLPVRDETYQQFIEAAVSEVDDALQIARADKSSSEAFKDPTVKQLQRRKASLEEKLKKRLAKEKKDNAINFEDLGVDWLFVDEFHFFKNLGYMSQMDRIAGLPNTDSERSTDMLLKSQYITSLHGGTRGLVGATGTPVSNSIAEIWTNMRYFMSPYLKQEGMDQFDAWAKTYGKKVTKIEVAPEGGRFIPRTRFSDFMNVGSLMQMFRTVADIRTKKQLNLPVPAIKTGGPQDIYAPASESLKAFIKHVGERADAIRSGQVKPDEDNMLKISSDARKASLDMRLVDPLAKEDPNSKANKAIAKVLEIYRNGHEHKSTQLIFLDLSTPKAEKVSKKKAAAIAEEVANVDEPDEVEESPYGSSEDEEEAQETETAEEATERFTVYDQIRKRLIAGGVKPEEIAFIHDANTDARKKELFDQMNSGEKRILLGSTEKMGAGMNVQKRLQALHHLDSPWRPSDMEQREGRIERQGNMLWDQYKIPAEIYRYSTEGSFDAFMWETIVSKAKPIEQFMNGDPSMDTIEELSPVVLSYEQAKAGASGNPKIREKILLDQDIMKLDIARGSWLTENAQARSALARLPGEMKAAKEAISNLESDVVTRDEHKDLIVDGKKFEAEQIRKGGAEAVNDALAKVGVIDKRKPLNAEYRGFPLVATPQEDYIDYYKSPSGDLYIKEQTDDKKWLYQKVTNMSSAPHATIHRADMTLKPLSKAEAEKLHSITTNMEAWRNSKYDSGKIRVWAPAGLSFQAKSHSYSISVNHDNPAGTISSADSQLRHFDQDLKTQKEQFTRMERMKVELEGKLDQPFKDEDRLVKMKERQRELERELGEKEDDAQAVGADEEGQKIDQNDPVAVLKADPNSAMEAKWFPKTKYFASTTRGGKETESGHAISDQLAVRKTKDRGWQIDHMPTGLKVAGDLSEAEAVHLARALSRGGANWNFTEATPEVTGPLGEAVRKIRNDLKSLEETPDQAMARVKGEIEKRKESVLTGALSSIEARERAAKAKVDTLIQEAGSTTSAGLGLSGELLAAYAELGALKIAKGVINFAAWSKEMLDEYGATLKPHLEKIWKEAQKLHDEGITEEPTATLDRPSGQISNAPSKPSRLAERIQDTALRENLGTVFSHIPEYETMNVAEQMQLAKNLIRDDLPRAIRIAKGEEEAGGKLRSMSVVVAVRQYAAETKDIDLMRSLGNRSLEASAMGQEIRMLGELSPTDPVAVINKVAAVRKVAAVKKFGKDGEKVIKAEVKAALKGANKQKDPWLKLLTELQCK